MAHSHPPCTTPQANGTDVELIMDVTYWMCFVTSVLIVSLRGLYLLYKILQITLLSWDTDGDGVVEFHEVIGAIKAYSSAFWYRIRRCRRPKKGALDGRTIEWRAFVYGVLDTLAHVDALLWTMIFFLMLYPGAFKRAIFDPCWDCDDFEAVVAQQVRRALAPATPISTSPHLTPSARLAARPGARLVNGNARVRTARGLLLDGPQRRLQLFAAAARRAQGKGTQWPRSRSGPGADAANNATSVAAPDQPNR